MAKALRAAVKAEGLAGGDYDGWHLSVTDKEVVRGIEGAAEAAAGGKGGAAGVQKIICVLRTLAGLRRASGWLDSGSDLAPVRHPPSLPSPRGGRARRWPL